MNVELLVMCEVCVILAMKHSACK